MTQDEIEKMKTEINNLKIVVGGLISILSLEIGSANAILLIEALTSERRSEI